MKRVLFFLVSVWLSVSVSAQTSVKDSLVSFFTICATGAIQQPAGDLGDRFGNNVSIGGSFQWKSRSNILLGIDGNFIFGDQVKENAILSDISTKQGYVIGVNGLYADVFLYERGYSIIAKAGKIFPWIGPNKNSGITFTGGLGFIQHKIRIEDKTNTAAPLTKEYKKGYDRLTNGICFYQFVGYTNFSNTKLVNFYIGFELMEAFTQNRRSYNFDTMMKDDSQRLDVLVGVKLGWMIPLYKRMPREYYYD